MSDNGISFLKGIGIRVHTVRYQKIRKRLTRKDNVDNSEEVNDHVTSREYKRLKGLFCIIR